MIIYNKTWLKNLQVREKVKLWNKRNLISEEHTSKILEAYPVGFYRPGFWVALGLFFFTCILLSAAGGLFTLFVASGGATGPVIFHISSLLFGLGCLFVAEVFKKEKHYYQAGTDNALVWAGVGSFISNIFWWLMEGNMDSGAAWTLGWLISFGICVAGSLRYADVFVALSAFVSWFMFLFFFVGQIGAYGEAMLPFIGLINAILVYYFAKKYEKHEKAQWYGECILLIQTAALIVAYISINYMVVREMTLAIFSISLGEGEDIPLAFLFYFLTVAIPIAYICWGLKSKDRIMLRIGLLLVVASILTIRHYHSILPIEKAMTLGGLLALAISYGLIRWLKTPQYGFTYEEDLEEPSLINVESLVVAQTFAPEAVKVNDGTQFGGGQYGGGGAGGAF